MLKQATGLAQGAGASFAAVVLIFRGRMQRRERLRGQTAPGWPSARALFQHPLAAKADALLQSGRSGGSHQGGEVGVALVRARGPPDLALSVPVHWQISKCGVDTDGARWPGRHSLHGVDSPASRTSLRALSVPMRSARRRVPSRMPNCEPWKRNVADSAATR